MSKPRYFVSAFVLILASLPASVAPAITIDYTPFNYPGSSFTMPKAMSGNEVVGYYDTPGNTVGFLYNTTTQQWTSLPEVSGAGFTPYGVSGNTIVGQGEGGSYSYNISTGVYTSIVDPNAPSGVNVQGLSGSYMAGWYYAPSTEADYGDVFNGSTWSEIDYPQSRLTLAYGINGDQVVGYYQDSVANGLDVHGFVYNMQTATWQSFTDPAGVQGEGAIEPATNITGISGNYMVGQFAFSDNVTSAFLYDSGTWINLGDAFANGMDGNYFFGARGGSDSGYIAEIVPEPSSIDLMVFGGLALAVIGFSRRSVRYRMAI